MWGSWLYGTHIMRPIHIRPINAALQVKKVEGVHREAFVLPSGRRLELFYDSTSSNTLLEKHEIRMTLDFLRLLEDSIVSTEAINILKSKLGSTKIETISAITFFYSV